MTSSNAQRRRRAADKTVASNVTKRGTVLDPAIEVRASTHGTGALCASVPRILSPPTTAASDLRTPSRPLPSLPQRTPLQLDCIRTNIGHPPKRVLARDRWRCEEPCI